MARYRESSPTLRVSDIAPRRLERMEREAFAREFNEREALEPRFSEDRFDPWHGRGLSAESAREGKP